MPTGRENIPVSRFEFWAEIRNQDVDVSPQIRMDCRAGLYGIVKGEKTRVFVTGNFSNIGIFRQCLVKHHKVVGLDSNPSNEGIAFAMSARL